MLVCGEGVEATRGKGPRPSTPVVCNAITCKLDLVGSVHCMKLVDMRGFMYASLSLDCCCRQANESGVLLHPPPGFCMSRTMAAGVCNR